MTTLLTLRVGQELEPFVVERVDPARNMLASAILDDPNPIHYDVQHVRQLGLGDALVNHGPLSLGYLANVAIRFAGGPGAVRRFRARFLGNVLAGDRLVCGGRVKAVEQRRARRRWT
jgi:acyl dehydratase